VPIKNAYEAAEGIFLALLGWTLFLSSLLLDVRRESAAFGNNNYKRKSERRRIIRMGRTQGGR
jgi:hypothetical protein